MIFPLHITKSQETYGVNFKAPWGVLILGSCQIFPFALALLIMHGFYSLHEPESEVNIMEADWVGV